MECLERASVAVNSDEREKLARDAFNYLTKIPESADLRAVCKRFEDLRLVFLEEYCSLILLCFLHAANS